MFDFHELSIRQLAVGYRSGEFSPVAVTEHLLALIEKWQPEINAFIHVGHEAALKRAALSEKRMKSGRMLSILDGIPCGIKDIIDVEGFPTTMGCRLYENSFPKESAFAVRKLENAGAVILGKTNTSQFALGATGEVSSAGPCGNPHDPTRISGGSSSGSAAAVAAGLVPFAIGTDTGGSVRAPASLCGVVGLRPTTGLISMSGCLPNCLMLDTIGILARSSKDIAEILPIMVGYDVQYPLSVYSEHSFPIVPVGNNLECYTIGIPWSYFRDNIDPCVARAFESAVSACEHLGCRIKSVDLEEIAQYREVMSDLLIAEAYCFHKSNLEKHSTYYAPEILKRFERGNSITKEEYIKLRNRVFPFKLAFRNAFSEVDLLALPTQPSVAIKRRTDPAYSLDPAAVEYYENSSRFLWFAAFAGYPAISIPCGKKKGLPIGIQLIGQPKNEKLLFSVSEKLESALGYSYRIQQKEN